MSEPYVEIEFKVPPRAFKLEVTDHPTFIDSVAEYGWKVITYDRNPFDLVVQSEEGWTVELWNGDYIVLFDNGEGKFSEGEAYDETEFKKRFVSK